MHLKFASTLRFSTHWLVRNAIHLHICINILNRVEGKTNKMFWISKIAKFIFVNFYLSRCLHDDEDSRDMATDINDENWKNKNDEVHPSSQNLIVAVVRRIRDLTSLLPDDLRPSRHDLVACSRTRPGSCETVLSRNDRSRQKFPCQAWIGQHQTDSSWKEQNLTMES